MMAGVQELKHIQAGLARQMTSGWEGSRNLGAGAASFHEKNEHLYVCSLGVHPGLLRILGPWEEVVSSHRCTWDPAGATAAAAGVMTPADNRNRHRLRHCSSASRARLRHCIRRCQYLDIWVHHSQGHVHSPGSSGFRMLGRGAALTGASPTCGIGLQVS